MEKVFEVVKDFPAIRFNYLEDMDNAITYLTKQKVAVYAILRGSLEIRFYGNEARQGRIYESKKRCNKAVDLLTNFFKAGDNNSEILTSYIEETIPNKYKILELKYNLVDDCLLEFQSEGITVDMYLFLAGHWELEDVLMGMVNTKIVFEFKYDRNACSNLIDYVLTGRMPDDFIAKVHPDHPIWQNQINHMPSNSHKVEWCGYPGSSSAVEEFQEELESFSDEEKSTIYSPIKFTLGDVPVDYSGEESIKIEGDKKVIGIRESNPATSFLITGHHFELSFCVYDFYITFNDVADRSRALLAINQWANLQKPPAIGRLPNSLTPALFFSCQTDTVCAATLLSQVFGNSSK